MLALNILSRLWSIPISRLLHQDGVHCELTLKHIADNNQGLAGANVLGGFEVGDGTGDGFMRLARVKIQHDGMNGPAEVQTTGDGFAGRKAKMGARAGRNHAA